jgi:hypothetical protein
LERRETPATFTVTSFLDAGPGTLRQAMTDANLSADPIDTIVFSVGAGLVTIQLLSPLPALTGSTVIDGATQPGFAGQPIVVLDGLSAGTGPGLQFNAADGDVRALVVHRFKGDGIQASGAFSTFSVKGCYIGVDPNGTNDLGNAGDGIAVLKAGPGPSTVNIGGPAAADRNVISGNDGRGVFLGAVTGFSSVTVENNYVGTDVTGLVDLGNTASGLQIEAGAASATARSNVFSGNGGDGIAVAGNFNSFESNICGLGADGKTVIGNSFSGIALFGGAQGNVVGGFDLSTANVVSANGTGIYCGNATTTDNSIAVNLVGTDGTGLLPRGNSFRGIWINDAPNNRIAGSVVCATTGDGVVIDGPNGKFNRVRNCFIGVGADGTTVIGNTNGGVNVFGGANRNLIGSGPKDSGPNVISGNTAFGVGLFDPGTNQNTVAGNFIGTDLGATLKIGNGGPGIAIANGASENLIIAADNGNTIAFNAAAGVGVSGATSLRNRISFNSIYENNGLGIDLGNDGVTANDPLDVDSGPNTLQNYPVLTFAEGGSSTKVAGTLNSLANTQYQLEFYVSPTADPSGFGEGAVPIGSVHVTTDANGDAAFNAKFNVFTPPGLVVTALAIDPDGNTSEFSLAKNAAAPSAPPCFDADFLFLVNFGEAQRSNVSSLFFAFDQIVTLPGNPADAFELKRQSDGFSAGLTATTFVDLGRTIVTLEFTGPGIVAGSLPDGRYTLTALASKIGNGNGQLDGDCNGTGGDDFVHVGSPSAEPRLIRLFGDSNGDGDVDAQDFGLFRLLFGSASPVFDFDGDGDVDAADFGQFRLRFGTSI